jgi:ABC-type transporter Mla subunit MlaD
MGGRGTARSLAASPTMVGAITTLVVIVAVFLAYNANQGLPFVPVYRVSAEMCNASRMAPNNEVRIGGNRVGVIESIEAIQLEEGESSPCTTDVGVGGAESTANAYAQLNLKLDESAKPLPDDSLVRVRYRSSFGLKYLEIERGQGSDLPEGGTLKLPQTDEELRQVEQTEFDDIGNTFDTATRESSRKVLEGFGSAFAGRGASLNQAIEALNPLFDNLKPVAGALADPTTELVDLFPELADAARIVAPVAEDNAQFFTHAAISFAAISSDPESLRRTIEEGVPTLETGIRSLPVQRPFLRDFAEFSRLLRPGVHDLRVSLPILNDAVSRGAKVLPRTVRTNKDLEGVLRELEELVDEPSTLISLVRLSDTFGEVDSAASFLVPYQTVCNYWNYWFQNLPEHFSGEVFAPGGGQISLAERLIAPGVPGTTTPDHFPRNPHNNNSGSQADGTFSPYSGAAVLSPEQRNKAGSLGPTETPAGGPPPPPVIGGAFDPQAADPAPGTAAGLPNQAPQQPFFNMPIQENEDDEVQQPILHAPAYGPSGTEAAPNCQAGQFGYILGEALSQNQHRDNPSFGIYNIAGGIPGAAPFGKTDIFLRQNGLREFAAPQAASAPAPTPQATQTKTKKKKKGCKQIKNKKKRAKCQKKGKR